MVHLFILAFLAGSPAGHSPAEFAFTMTASPAGLAGDPVDQSDRPLTMDECMGAGALRAAAAWAALHPSYVVVGTRCRIGDAAREKAA